VVLVPPVVTLLSEVVLVLREPAVTSMWKPAMARLELVDPLALQPALLKAVTCLEVSRAYRVDAV
jgi:hypothetical protein